MKNTIKKLNRSFSICSKIAGFVTLVLTSIFNTSYSQTKIDKIDNLVSAYSEFGQFNGSVLIAEKGKIIYKKGFGWANMEWNIPNQTDTKFRLASISKQFTAMLIMQFVQQGKLKLNVPISNYLPDYPKPNGSIITIHQLLTHTSGTPNYTSFPNFIKNNSRNPYTPAEFLNYFADSTLRFKPGEKFSYSNSGYFLLGILLEKVSGKSYEQVLHENILEPLGMNNTGYEHYNTVLKNRASAYEKLGTSYINANYLDMSILYAAGALYSTVEDLYLWDQALYTNKLLQKENMELLFAKHVPVQKRYYGYGWFIDEMGIGNTKERVQTISHSGEINGFNTLISRISSDTSLIILLNNTGAAPLKEMSIAICGILYDKPYDLPKKSIAYSLMDVIKEKGIEAALTSYKDKKAAADYFLDQNEMNLAGYQLLQSNKTKEAAAIFKLNVEAFPNSANVYDSYGEALLALGEKAQAIENYKKSVKLNPNNENGIKVLKGLGVNTDDLITKVSIESLKLLEGKYVEVGSTTPRKIEFKEVNGILNGNEGSNPYQLTPVGENEFINPVDGISLIFNTRNKKEITLLLFGKVKFKKVM